MLYKCSLLRFIFLSFLPVQSAPYHFFSLSLSLSLSFYFTLYFSRFFLSFFFFIFSLSLFLIFSLSTFPILSISFYLFITLTLILSLFLFVFLSLSNLCLFLCLDFLFLVLMCVFCFVAYNYWRMANELSLTYLVYKKYHKHKLLRIKQKYHIYSFGHCIGMALLLHWPYRAYQKLFLLLT